MRQIVWDVLGIGVILALAVTMIAVAWDINERNETAMQMLDDARYFEPSGECRLIGFVDGEEYDVYTIKCPADWGDK